MQEDVEALGSSLPCLIVPDVLVNLACVDHEVKCMNINDTQEEQQVFQGMTRYLQRYVNYSLFTCVEF